MSELLAALHYAHTLVIDGEPQGIVHRDISPSNILISRHGEVKLTDFGIAKARGRLHHTQTGHIKGKVAYMSPEQIRAEPLDGRSDLFSLGVVLFELLTGVHPFDGGTDFAIQLSIMEGKRPTLPQLRPDLPEAIMGLVDALLATDVAQRPSALDALARLPLTQPAFVLQRELAALVQGDDASCEDARATAGARATEDVWARPASGQVEGRQAWSSDGAGRAHAGAASHAEARPAPSSEGAALVRADALSAASLHPLAGSVVELEGRRSRGAARKWWLVPLLLLALGASYGLLRSRASGPPALPSLTTLAEDPRALHPGAPAQPVDEVVTPAKGAANGAPVERVISPPKSGDTVPPRRVEEVISPAKSAQRSRTEAVERVVSPHKAEPTPEPGSLERVVSPHKAEPAPRSEPLEQVVTPRKTPRTAGATSIELVISPPKSSAP